MSCNVLIVDDSFSMRSVVKKVLKLSGLVLETCYEAENGREALKVLSDNWVDVIVTDLNMPEMDGVEFIKRLKNDPLYKEIPVIVVSTEASRERIEEVTALGIKNFMRKPFLPEQLKKTIHDALGMEDRARAHFDEDEGTDF